MKVYLLIQERMRYGIGEEKRINAYECLRAAQQDMCHDIYLDEQYGGFDHISLDGKEGFDSDNDICEMSNKYYTDLEFQFPVFDARLWSGDEGMELSENWVHYEIQEKELI